MKLAVLVIAIIIILGVFGISLRSAFNNRGVLNDNFLFVWEKIKWVWENFLKKPLIFTWDIIYKIIWQPVSVLYNKFAN